MHNLNLTDEEMDSVATFCEMYLDMMQDCKGQDPVVDRCISDAGTILARLEAVIGRNVA